jgi:hypothetical protein
MVLLRCHFQLYLNPQVPEFIKMLKENLSTFSTNTTSKLDILGHNCYSLCMDGTQVGILKETNEVCLSGLLKGENSSRLKTKISLEVLSNLTDKTLEGCLADEKVGRLLVLTDLTESYSSGTVTVGLLDSSCCGCRLACSLGSELCGEEIILVSLLASGAMCGERMERRPVIIVNFSEQILKTQRLF